MKRNIPEITDEQRSVLQIKDEDGSKSYLASFSFMLVGNPKYATRYPPLDPDFPERAKDREVDMNWMKGSCYGEIEFVPFLDACNEHNSEIEAYEEF